jgi:hypothetical protein
MWSIRVEIKDQTAVIFRVKGEQSNLKAQEI